MKTAIILTNLSINLHFFQFTLFFFLIKKIFSWDFPGGAVVGNLPANAGDTGSSPGPGRSHMPRKN